MEASVSFLTLVNNPSPTELDRKSRADVILDTVLMLSLLCRIVVLPLALLFASLHYLVEPIRHHAMVSAIMQVYTTGSNLNEIALSNNSSAIADIAAWTFIALLIGLLSLSALAYAASGFTGCHGHFCLRTDCTGLKTARATYDFACNAAEWCLILMLLTVVVSVN
jgi:hypothetical protein